MPSTRRRLPVLVLAALIAGACGSTSGPTPRPSEPGGPTAVPATPQAAERPFARVAWPAAATACADGAAPLLRQVEATDARTVRFTLCRPDGAFLARLAHPALGVVDAAALDALAADPSAARSVAGAGPYRVEAWIPGRTSVSPASGPSQERWMPYPPSSCAGARQRTRAWPPSRAPRLTGSTGPAPMARRSLTRCRSLWGSIAKA